eukprot:TCALIF_11077-PA protein Name:"Similar to DPP10 Inactive dipeptidyl peptidase 10 (Homo sapiens)" AED:0.12 eAED:0.12 QI:0/0.84/0.64/0.92/0.76/0.85/14/214/869
MSGADPQVADVAGPTVVHKVKSKFGYTEMHATAPGFGENLEVLQGGQIWCTMIKRINSDSLQELVAAEADQKNWKGITIAILMILLILAGVGVAVLILTPPPEDDSSKGRPFEIEDIIDPQFVPRTFNGSWISDSEIVFRDAQDHLSILSTVDFKPREIVINTVFRRFNVAKYSLSPSQKYLLLTHDFHKRYRFSSFAQYTVYEIESGLTWPVSTKNDDSSIRSNQNGLFQLQYARWMPSREDSSNGNDALVFVENYTVFYIPDVSQTSKRIFPVSSIEDVIPEVVIHGIPDWIYEEDILKADNALWPSPNGQKLVYVTFNDSKVEEVRWNIYGNDASARGNNPYPHVGKMRYPKAGTTNPSIKVWMVNFESLENLEQRELYPPKATFAYEFQTNFFLLDAMVLLQVYREDVQTQAWSTLHDPPIFSSNGGSFVLKAPIRDGDSGHFQQVVLIQLKPKRLTHPLTIGHNEVKKILSWDEEREVIYFLAVPKAHPSQRHLFAVSSNWEESPFSPECLTCNLSRKALGRDCRVHDAVMSPSNTHFILNCLGPDVPGVYLIPIESDLDNQTLSFGSNITLLDNNSQLIDLMSTMAYPKIEMLDIPNGKEDGGVLKAKMYLPLELDPELLIQYPLVLHVYSGPGSQLVTDDWKIDFNVFVATKLKYVVLEVDGSGSSGRGEALLSKVKHALGQNEVHDQIHALRHVINNYTFIDGNRVGVTGVSYGGYMAGMLLSHPEADFINCGVSVSPVVDWRLYESSYSERYMGFPSPTGNFKGYEEGSLLNRIKAIQGKHFFLAHGMADRNVHFQHSMILAKKLVESNIPFEQQVYPDEGHFLEGAKLHLYSSVSQFLQEKCFYVPPTTDEEDKVELIV